MQTKALVAVAAATVAAGSLAAPASAGKRVETTAVFTNSGNDGGGNFRYFGQVEADGTQKCVPDRKVDFYRKEEGPDTFIGRTRTDSFGVWSITIPLDIFSEGFVYVRVLRKTLKSGTVCLPAKSNEFHQI